MAAVGVIPARNSFRHEALFYSGEADFVARLAPFISEGVHRREPVLVVVPAPRVELLRDALGRDANGVVFGDMIELGRNPSRIIPVWRRFLADRPAGYGARGVGEPAHSDRSADELVECRRHEMLLNVAFEGSSSWSLVCPYDTSLLAPNVVAEATRTHPYVDFRRNPRYAGPDLPDDPLPTPPAGRTELPFTAGPLDAVHAFVRANATSAGLSVGRVDDLDLAVHELAINTVRHASGSGTVLFWVDGGFVFCEVRDDGVIRDPLAGRWDPTLEQESGRGLWIVNQLCDLVEVRSNHAGTTIRVRLSLAPVPVHETAARHLR